MTKKEILKEYFGYSDFRKGQEKIIDEILLGRDVMGIMPTGAGKSLCYQIPALMLPGITLVISPLISLMKDQVNALLQSGVKAAYLNSSLTFGQYCEALRRAKSGRYKIIYVAPERLLTEGFMDFANSVDISMITVDEAHCVSQWGQDFRPNYLKINQFVKRLKKRPIISAFTATATPYVKSDIIRILELNNPFEIMTGFNRENLYFEVIKTNKKFERLYSILKENEGKCSIVYCATRKAVDELSEKLQDKGFKTSSYHAGMEDEQRQENQEAFQNDKTDIMVATNAFGMGIDKSNVSMVIHYNMPKNIESYYQEAGRAGRDLSPAKCIMLYSPQDILLNKFLIEKSEPNADLTPEQISEVKEKDMERLNEIIKFSNTTKCLRGFLMDYFGDIHIDKCDNCSNCLSSFYKADITYSIRIILLCIYELQAMGKAFGKQMLIDILTGIQSDERINDYKLDELSTYAVMSKTSRKALREYMDYAMENDYIFVNRDRYKVLELTQKGNEFLEHPIKIEIMQKQEPKKETPRKREISNSGALFEELKRLRTHIAIKMGMPPYVIFSDLALRQMVDKQPTNDEEFLRIYGVGNLKLKKYGEEFMRVIREYKHTSWN